VCFIFLHSPLPNDRDGRRPSEKRFVPGIARARTSRGLLCANLSQRCGGSSNRRMSQPRQAHSPEDEGPKSTGQPLLAVCLPLTRAPHLSLGHRGLPGLVPAPLADPIAQQQHGIDVLSSRAACQPLLTVLRQPVCWRFPRSPNQWANLLAARWDSAGALHGSRT